MFHKINVYRNPIIRMAGFAAMAGVCVALLLYWYPRTQSEIFIAFFLVPVFYAAGVWGRAGGLGTAAAACIVSTSVVIIYAPDEAIQVAIATAFVFVNAGGLIGSLFKIRRELRNKTEQLTQAVEQLQESEERYRSLYMGMPIGLYRTTPDGEIVDANDALVTTLGSSDRAKLLGENAAAFYAEKSQRDYMKSMLELNGRVENFETQIVRGDGKHITALISVRQISHGKKGDILYEGSMMDITERKGLQEERIIVEHQRRRAERMTSVAELAAGVAHDFNNILSSIQTYAQSILLTTPEEDRRRASAEHITSLVDRGSGVVDGLLAAIGSYLLSQRRIDLRETARNAFANAVSDLPELVQSEYAAADYPVWATLDPDTVVQCIQELIRNASRAINNAGKIHVSCGLEPLERATLYSQPKHGDATHYACICVGDDGYGMDENTMNRIFDPYFTTQEFGKSAGIGMTKVYGLVHQQQGLIGIKSSPGAGTTVKLYFPVEKRSCGPH